MTIPHWSTIALFVVLVIQFIVLWRHARKTGKSFQEAVLPAALLAGAVSIIFVRAFFGDLPLWIDAPMLILCSLIILFLVGLAALRLKRYVKDAWRLDGKRDQ